jgi:hypothetical protein
LVPDIPTTSVESHALSRELRRREDPASVAAVHHQFIERIGWEATRRELALRSDVGRPPTLGELEDAAREFGLSVITLSAPDDERPQPRGEAAAS